MAGKALDFESIPRALELVRRRGLRDMELVIIEDPARTTTVPVEKLHLGFSWSEANGAQGGAGERKPTKSTRAARAAVIALARQPRIQKTRKVTSKAAETGRLRRKLRPARAKK